MCNFRLPESFTTLVDLQRATLNNNSLTCLPVNIGGFVIVTTYLKEFPFHKW